MWAVTLQMSQSWSCRLWFQAWQQNEKSRFRSNYFNDKGADMKLGATVFIHITLGTTLKHKLADHQPLVARIQTVGIIVSLTTGSARKWLSQHLLVGSPKSREREKAHGVAGEMSSPPVASNSSIVSPQSPQTDLSPVLSSSCHTSPYLCSWSSTHPSELSFTNPTFLQESVQPHSPPHYPSPGMSISSNCELGAS